MADGREIATIPEESALTVYQELKQQSSKTQITPAELEEKLRDINENVNTRLQNVMGSSAGSGSGDFHQYRSARRREMFRLQRMEEEYEKRTQDEEWQLRRAQRLAEQEATQEKKSAKRKAKKERQKANKAAKRAGGSGNEDGGGEQDDGPAKETARTATATDPAQAQAELD